MTIANKGNKPFDMKDLFPVTNLTGQKPSMHMTENTNSIAGLGWQTVASKSLAAISELFAPLDRYTTDYTNEIVAFGPGSSVTLKIEIAKTVGEAIKDAKDWNISDVTTEAVDIVCHRYSRPFLVTSYDMAAGSRLEGKLYKAIEAVAKAVLKDLHTQIKTAQPGVISGLTLDSFTPEYVATVLSGLIIPEVSALTVNPTYHAKLTPYNADSLKLETGVYGIGGIYKATGLESLSDDKKTIGYMGYENAIGIISRQPLIPTDNGAIFVSELGSVGGIKMYLKQWVLAGMEGIMHSVEAAVGSVVAMPESLRLLSTASSSDSSPASTPVSETEEEPVE